MSREETEETDLPSGEEGEERKSKSAMKREMLQLQTYGAKLVELSIDQLGRIEMPETLREAVLEAKRISPSKHGARKRQVHHIGAMLRDIDAGPIIAIIDNTEEVRRDDARHFRQIELWRDRLIEGEDTVFEEIVEAHPEIDRQHIHQLVRNAQKEKEENRPPKSARAIFRYLMALENDTPD